MSFGTVGFGTGTVGVILNAILQLKDTVENIIPEMPVSFSLSGGNGNISLPSINTAMTGAVDRATVSLNSTASGN